MLHAYRFFLLGIGITLIFTGIITLLVIISGYEISTSFVNDELLLSISPKDFSNNNPTILFGIIFLLVGVLIVSSGLRSINQYVIKQRKSNDLKDITYSSIEYDNLEKIIDELVGKYKDMTDELFADQTSITSIITKTSRLANIKTNLNDMAEKKYIFSKKFWISSYGITYMWNRFFKYTITSISNNPLNIFKEFWLNIPLKGGYFTYHLLRKRIIKNCHIINATFDLFLMAEIQNPESKRKIKQIVKNIDTTKNHIINKEPKIIKNFIFKLQILSSLISIFTFLSIFTLIGLDVSQEIDRIKHPFYLQTILFVILLVTIIIFIYWILPQLKWYKSLIQKYETYHSLKKTETDVFTLLLPVQKNIIEKSFPEMRKILDGR